MNRVSLNDSFIQVYEWNCFIKKNLLKRKIRSLIQFSHWLTDFWSWYFINYGSQKKINNDLGFRRPSLFLELYKCGHYEMYSDIGSWSTDCPSNPLLIWKPLEGNCCTCLSGHGDKKLIKTMSFGIKGGKKNAWSPNCHIIFEARLSLHLPRSSCWH